MKCHQERKEAKRQREREERERMERAERAMEKSLPTIPESEHKQPHESQSPRPNSNPASRYHQPEPVPDRRAQPDMTRPQQPIQSNRYGTNGYNNAQSGPTPRSDSRPKPNGTGLPSLDVGPPFLPPLLFGLDEAVTSGFDLGDMLSESEKDSKGSSPSTPSSKDVELVNGQDRGSYRLSIARADARLSTSTLTLTEKPSFGDGLKPLSSSSSSMSEVSGSTSITAPKRISDRFLNPMPHSPATSEPSEENMNPAEAAVLIRELRVELAKYNPMSPLIHGTPQQEYGLLHEKIEKLTQKHTQLEKAVRDLYIEKDLLGMDLEAMNEELRTKEEAIASNDLDKLQPSMPLTSNPRMSTSHDFMKQAYQSEVKALQEQKERLQREIQTYVEQRDGVLDEMQILSVRNAELSTMNNDMMREMYERKDNKPTPPAAPSSTANAGGGWFSSGKRRQRQVSGGSQQELKAPQLAVARSSDSTYSFNSTNSDDPLRSIRNKREEIQEDIFGEEIISPKKFNWKKGAMNTLGAGASTVKSVGAMFGKLMVEGPGYGAEATNGRNGQMMSDTGSSNGQILPPTRSFSVNSETGSINGRSTEQHYFIQYNYLKPVRCDCCDDKLWGREYRCRGCGFQIHSRCTNEIVPACSGKLKDSDSSSLRNFPASGSGGSSYGAPPSPPAKQIMFGNNLLDQLELEQRDIPLVVEKCIEAVDQRGLDVEGIYRRSGMAAEARQLVQAYDVGLYPDLMDSSLYQDICSITSVLKQYLRSLPEPLVPYDLYTEFLDAVGLPHNEAKFQVFHDLLDRMPYAHYLTLKVLLEHLNRVTELESVNLMHAKNLSVVFGPTLMRNPDPSREIMDMSYKNMTVEFLIVNTSELFIRSERPSFSSATNEINNGAGQNGQTGIDTASPASPSSAAAPAAAPASSTAAPAVVPVAAAASPAMNGSPNGFTGQRQGSVGSLSQNPAPPPRRMPGHVPSPVMSQEN
ncbi:hypothetical protein BGZ54_001106, partial [Gamsiella multidivaricata]